MESCIHAVHLKQAKHLPIVHGAKLVGIVQSILKAS